MTKTVFKSASFLKTPGQISKKKGDIYKNAFGDLPDGTVYWDPANFRTGRTFKGSYKDKIWEANKDLVKEFDKYQKNNFSVSESIKEVRKNYDTGDWSIPIAHIPEVNVVKPEQTPVADMIARETTNSDTVRVTRETDQAEDSVEMGLENTSDTEGSYTYADGTYDTDTFDVIGYGLATRLEDKMILASNQIRSTENIAQQAQMTAMRQAEERQLLFGTDFNANGWDGFKQLGSVHDSVDASGSTIEWQSKVRELIDEVEYAGGDRGSMAVVTNFESHRKLRNDLTDVTRYEMGDQDELGFGFSTLEFDGVPVMKSSAMVKESDLTSGDPIMFAVDMSENYMSMLRDMSITPLAKIAPQEQFATDAYGTLVSEAPEHILFYDET